MIRAVALFFLSLTACTPVGVLTAAIDAAGKAKHAHDQKEAMHAAERDLDAARKARADAERRRREKVERMIAANKAKRDAEEAERLRERDERQAVALASQPEIEPPAQKLPSEIAPVKTSTVNKIADGVARAKAMCKRRTLTSSDRRCLDAVLQYELLRWAAERPTLLADMLKASDESLVPDRLLNLKSRSVPEIELPPKCANAKPEDIACIFVPLITEFDAYIHGRSSIVESYVERLHALADKQEADDAKKAEEDKRLLSTDGVLRIARGPKIGQRFNVGSWGFEIDAYNLALDDEGGYVLTVDFIAENRSRSEQLVSSRFVYLLDKTRIKVDSARIEDLMVSGLSGRSMIEHIPPATRVRRRSTFRTDLPTIDGGFSIVFQDPHATTKRTEIQIERL